MVWRLRFLCLIPPPPQHSGCVLFTINALLLLEIRLLENQRCPKSVDHYLAAAEFIASSHTPPHLGIAQPWGYQMLMRWPICMYSLRKHPRNQSWPVLSGLASKYDNLARWTQEESCMWERDRGWKQTLLTCLHLSIMPLLIWFPSAPFSAVIADDITTACGAELHLEVKTVLSYIKNTFLFPDPQFGGCISQVRGSIWFIEKASSFEDRTLGIRIETVISDEMSTGHTQNRSFFSLYVLLCLK